LAFTLIILSVVAGKIVYWLSTKVVKKITSRTKGRFDDILIDMLEEPLVFAVIIIGIWYSLDVLSIDALAEKWIDGAYYILIIFNAAWFISRIFEALMSEYIIPIVSRSTSDLDDMLLPLLQRGIKAGIWIIAILVAINNAGYDVGALLAGLGIGGLAVALAAQETLSNLIAGITIIADKPFVLNDWVQIDREIGQIKEIGLRSTRIMTTNNTRLIIPNSKLVNNKVENLTTAPGRRIELFIPLEYESTPQQLETALNLIEQIIRNHPNTLDDVAVLFRNFENFAFNVRIRYFVAKGKPMTFTRNQINLGIYKALIENKISLALPAPAFAKKFDPNKQLLDPEHQHHSDGHAHD
jgi:MscS family membrane protein